MLALHILFKAQGDPMEQAFLFCLGRMLYVSVHPLPKAYSQGKIKQSWFFWVSLGLVKDAQSHRAFSQGKMKQSWFLGVSLSPEPCTGCTEP